MKPSGTELSDRTWGSPSGLPFFCRRKAFTLVELLVVFSIIAVLAGTFSLNSVAGMMQKGSPQSIARESADLARWINGRMYKATLEKRSFSFRSLPCSTPVQWIIIRWADTGELEKYDSQGNCYFTIRGSAVSNAVYNPYFHTVTPGFTLKVVESPSKTTALKYIRVSVYGRVSVTDDPPE